MTVTTRPATWYGATGDGHPWIVMTDGSTLAAVTVPLSSDVAAALWTALDSPTASVDSMAAALAGAPTDTMSGVVIARHDRMTGATDILVRGQLTVHTTSGKRTVESGTDFWTRTVIADALWLAVSPGDDAPDTLTGAVFPLRSGTVVADTFVWPVNTRPARAVSAVVTDTASYSYAVRGQVSRLDRPHVIGRRPATPNAGSPVELVTVESPAREVSASHLMLEPADVAVFATDLNSSNGTRVRSEHGAWVTMLPGVAIRVLPGTQLDLGDGNVIEILPSTVSGNETMIRVSKES